MGFIQVDTVADLWMPVIPPWVVDTPVDNPPNNPPNFPPIVTSNKSIPPNNPPPNELEALDSSRAMDVQDYVQKYWIFGLAAVVVIGIVVIKK